MGGLLQRRAPGAAWVHLLKSFSEKWHKNGFAYVLRPHRTVYRLTSPGDVSFVWVFQKLYCYKAPCFVTVWGCCKTPGYNKTRKNSWLKDMVFLQCRKQQWGCNKGCIQEDPSEPWVGLAEWWFFMPVGASARPPILHRKTIQMIRSTIYEVLI